MRRLRRAAWRRPAGAVRRGLAEENGGMHQAERCGGEESACCRSGAASEIYSGLISLRIWYADLLLTSIDGESCEEDDEQLGLHAAE